MHVARHCRPRAAVSHHRTRRGQGAGGNYPAPAARLNRGVAHPQHAQLTRACRGEGWQRVLGSQPPFVASSQIPKASTDGVRTKMIADRQVASMADTAALLAAAILGGLLLILLVRARRDTGRGGAPVTLAVATLSDCGGSGSAGINTRVFAQWDRHLGEPAQAAVHLRAQLQTLRKHGSLVDVAVVRDRCTGKCANCAFVSFSTVDEATRAVAAAQDAAGNGLRCSWAVPGGSSRDQTAPIPREANKASKAAAQRKQRAPGTPKQRPSRAQTAASEGPRGPNTKGAVVGIALCKQFATLGQCAQGDGCAFAHCSAKYVVVTSTSRCCHVDLRGAAHQAKGGPYVYDLELLENVGLLDAGVSAGQEREGQTDVLLRGQPFVGLLGGSGSRRLLEENVRNEFKAARRAGLGDLSTLIEDCERYM